MLINTVFYACVVLLLASAHVVKAVDCNACRYRCRLTDLSCPGKKALCQTTAATFTAYRKSVEAVCANEPGRMDDMDRVDAAKTLLISKGVLSPGDFDGVQIRWCSQLRDFADGMTLSAGKVLLHPRLKSEGTRVTATVLAHEMYHVGQYRAWGEDGFSCRYSVELASGNGFKKSNSVERPAYEFDAQADAKLISPQARPAATAPQQAGFYRQVDQAEVYMVYAPGQLYCWVQNPSQLTMLSKGAKTQVAARLSLPGQNTGYCGWPNGLFRVDGTPEVYYLSGSSPYSGFGLGDAACHVKDPAQLEAFRRAGAGNTAVVPPGSELQRGRTFAGPCADPGGGGAGASSGGGPAPARKCGHNCRKCGQEFPFGACKKCCW